MNYALLSKLGGVLLSAGGFGFSSWLFWPESTPIPEYFYLYTISENLTGSDHATKNINKNINKNFQCKINNKNIDCDILEPESSTIHSYSATSSTKYPEFKANPEKLTIEDLKKEKNVYVLQIDKKYEKDIQAISPANKIEIISTQEQNKKYASLKLNVVLDETGKIVLGIPNTSGTDNKAISILQNQLSSSTNEETKKKTQEQMMDIIADSNKMAIANKIFENCNGNTQPQSFGCANVEKSLNMLTSNLNNNPDGTPNVLTSVLVNQSGNQISDFFAIIDTQTTLTTPQTVVKQNNVANVLAKRNSEQLTTFLSVVDTVNKQQSNPPTSTSTQTNTNEQLFNILSDSNKLNIANKIFSDCKDDAKPQSLGCKDVKKSLDIMSNKFKNETEDSPSDLTNLLLKQNGRQISAFLTAVETTEKIKESLKPTNVLTSLFSFFQTPTSN